MAERWDEHDRAATRDDRGYRGREQGERGTAERAGDEVRSWFGDDDAAQRRRMDEMRNHRHDRDWADRGGRTAERTWDRARDTVREATDRDHDGRRGFAEWNDNDRSSGTIAPAAAATPRGRDDYWNRERNFTEGTRYTGSNETYSTPRWGNTASATTGRYAGRGPRGYTRSDERIREDVCDRLTDDARIDASDVEVQVKEGEVTLAGSVRTREEKRYTEDVIERITGVRDVNNHLKVKPADEIIGTARSGSSVLGLTDTPPPPPTTRTK